jgi:RHS repeat-associated protein
MTDASGTRISDCTYAPYGEQVACSPDNPSNRYRYTGKERDTETGLDYYGARYYANGMGRFITPDEPLLDQDSADPQSWNLYVYAANNPLLYTDFDGHSHVDPNGYTVGDKDGECNSNGDCWSDKNQDWERPQPPPPANDVVFEQVFHSAQARSTWRNAGSWIPLVNNAIGRAVNHPAVQALASLLFFNADEQVIADMLEDEGSEVVPLATTAGQRSADALVNGIKTEFKTLQKGATSSTLRNSVNASIKGGGQARNIIINARDSGLTEAEATRGLSRVGGFAAGKVDSVRIIGDGFDITKSYK